MQLFETESASLAPPDDIKPGSLVEDGDGDVFIVTIDGVLLPVRNYHGETLTTRHGRFDIFDSDAMGRQVTQPVKLANIRLIAGRKVQN